MPRLEKKLKLVFLRLELDEAQRVKFAADVLGRPFELACMGMSGAALRWPATCVHDTCDHKQDIEHSMIHTFTSATLSSRALGGKKFCRSYASDKEHEVGRDRGRNTSPCNRQIRSQPRV
jgi:hypothetical protein